MTRAGALAVVVLALAGLAAVHASQDQAGPTPDASPYLAGIKATIQQHLGRPYVWGASGLKSFDCSGFLWRVMTENGVLLKRTTARKFYMMLRPVPKDEQWSFGTVVFFNNLTHVGIIDSREAFYHAEVSIGTNRSKMNAFWRTRIHGFRRLPLPLSE